MFVGAAAMVLASGGTLGMLPVSATAEPDAPPSIVEDFTYPGGDKIDGIRLIKGDGHILFIECDQPARSVEVWSFTQDTPFCFEIRGTKGYVSLELADAYGIRNYNDFPLSATVSVAGTEKAVQVPINDWVGVGPGANEGPAVLLEIQT
ncbi:hypothetical protein [Salinispora fenicalii]|uniref:hypothetical protein n=1 Tax=Salinispora fenicalii TaxID=1137263 RepID=UPI00067E6858|nr:hypothetical protein [Salinispora fenicalii]